MVMEDLIMKNGRKSEEHMQLEDMLIEEMFLQEIKVDLIEKISFTMIQKLLFDYFIY